MIRKSLLVIILMSITAGTLYCPMSNEEKKEHWGGLATGLAVEYGSIAAWIFLAHKGFDVKHGYLPRFLGFGLPALSGLYAILYSIPLVKEGSMGAEYQALAAGGCILACAPALLFIQLDTYNPTVLRIRAARDE